MLEILVGKQAVWKRPLSFRRHFNNSRQPGWLNRQLSVINCYTTKISKKNWLDSTWRFIIKHNCFRKQNWERNHHNDWIRYSYIGSRPAGIDCSGGYCCQSLRYGQKRLEQKLIPRPAMSVVIFTPTLSRAIKIKIIHIIILRTNPTEVNVVTAPALLSIFCFR